MVFGYCQYFDWQNTFAPNDSYVYIANTELTEEEIEAEKQNIGAIKKVGLTDDAYQEHCRHFAANQPSTHRDTTWTVYRTRYDA